MFHYDYLTENTCSKAVDIPAKIGGCIPLGESEAVQLYAIVRKMMGALE